MLTHSRSIQIQPLNRCSYCKIIALCHKGGEIGLSWREFHREHGLPLFRELNHVSLDVFFGALDRISQRIVEKLAQHRSKREE